MTKLATQNSNIVSLLLVLLIGSMMSVTTLAGVDTDCSPDEKEINFHILFDDDSRTEQGWTLTCDEEQGGPLWDVRPGDLEEILPSSSGRVFPRLERKPMMQNRRPVLPIFKAQACIPEDWTCDFTIIDQAGNGIEHPGYYTLTAEATTIAAYDGDVFSERSYCFGPHCTMPSQEHLRSCDDVYFYLQLDGAPEETSYKIECDGRTLWEQSGADMAEAGEKIIEQMACVHPPPRTCSLAISDSGNDGLTKKTKAKYSVDEDSSGAVYLDWGGQKIIDYKGSDGLTFSTLSVNFGLDHV